MKLPSSKIYWSDYLSYSALLTDKEVCQVMKLIAMRAMSYEREEPQENNNLNETCGLSKKKPAGYEKENPQDSKLKLKLIQKQILKLNNIQLDFYKCLEKAQDDSAKDYIASITNGKKGGRPKGKKTNTENLNKETPSADSNSLLKQNESNEFSVSVDYGERVLVGENFKINYDDEFFHPYRLANEKLTSSVEGWLIRNKLGKVIDKNFICRQITNFAKRQGSLSELLGE